AALANQRVEVCAGLGGQQNFFLLADTSEKGFVGFHILHPGALESGDDLQVCARRGSLAHRQYDEGVKWNASREVEDRYLIRGVCRLDTGGQRQKATLIVESVLPAPIAGPTPPARPPGRAWFVRTGASGGDGSREKPFRDPFQALEKAEGGDT